MPLHGGVSSSKGIDSLLFGLHTSSMSTRTKAKLSAHKAKKILRHGEVHGKPLTERQRGLFGLIAGGGRPTRLKK